MLGLVQSMLLRDVSLLPHSLPTVRVSEFYIIVDAGLIADKEPLFFMHHAVCPTLSNPGTSATDTMPRWLIKYGLIGNINILTTSGHSKVDPCKYSTTLQCTIHIRTARLLFCRCVPINLILNTVDLTSRTKLNSTMPSDGLFPGANIGDVMNTKGGYLCYEYE